MKRRHWLRWAGSVALTAVLTAAGTTSCSSPPDEPACGGKAPFSLDAKTYADVGKPGNVKGTSQPRVVVLDEKHPSRVGQVEIAIMLNRLYHSANLRHLGLEGSVTEEPAPDLTWFTSFPDPSIRRAVALQLLREGEVSAAEFAAMVLPGFQLHAIEHDNEYRVDLPPAAGQSYNGYLTAIAVTTMTPDEMTQANSLLDQKKYEDAIRYIINTDPWTLERYETLERPTPVLSSEEMQNLGVEIEKKAQEVGADVASYRSDFESAQKFFDTATQRSKTMVTNTADIAAGAGECAPIAMNVGAAHTSEITGLLDQKNMSYAVVSPLSLTSGSDEGNLSAEAYDRKLLAQSVDPAGAIGARADERRKPPPSSGQEWFKTKAELVYASVAIARAAGDGDELPFGLDQNQLGLGGSGPESPNIAIDLSAMRTVPVHTGAETRIDVIFQVKFLKQDTTMWVRAGQVAEPLDVTDSRTLERALKQMRDQLPQEALPTDPPTPSGPPVAVLTPDVKAAVANTPEELLDVNI